MRKIKAQSKILLLFLTTLFLQSCQEEVILNEQNDKNFKVYDINEIPQINSKIKQHSKQEVFTKNGTTGSEAYWIDNEYIFGAVDDNGNKSFSYRLYFNQMPKNTFYNIIITEREENEVTPFVIEFELENSEKKSIRYYELEYFLNALTKRQEKINRSKIGLITKNDEITDKPLDFNDCGHI